MRETFNNKIFRKNYGKIKEILDIPNLIEIQLDSYVNFLQRDISPEKRVNIGLQAVFKSVFPIKDSHDTTSLDFVKYEMVDPKNSEEECLFRGLTYAAPMRVTIRLVVWNIDPVTKNKRCQGCQRTGCLFWRDPTYDRKRNLYHQWYRKGHREPAPQVSRGLLRHRSCKVTHKRDPVLHCTDNSIQGFMA